MQNIMNVIQQRHSTRSYLDTPVPHDVLRMMLEAGGFAPSGKNGQPWRFSIIQENQSMKNEIAELTIYKRWVRSAPCMIAVWLDRQASYDLWKDYMAIGACIQNQLLVAQEQGLGACWLGEICNDKKKINEILGVPEHFDLMAILTVGYVKTDGIRTSRRSVDDNLIASDRLL